jgi:hypothetical protein
VGDEVFLPQLCCLVGFWLWGYVESGTFCWLSLGERNWVNDAGG